MSDDDNTVLLDAILSMDVYKREEAVTSPEISKALAATGDTLGSATIVDSKFDSNTAHGAVIWEHNGNLIIAYRGTVGSQFFTEAANGYGVGAGSPLGPQAAEALAYYHVRPSDFVGGDVVHHDHIAGSQSRGEDNKTGPLGSRAANPTEQQAALLLNLRDQHDRNARAVALPA